MSDFAVTRRAALARFAALTGSLAVAGFLPTVAGAAVVGGFDQRRQKIFRALLTAYDDEGPIQTGSRDLVGELQTRYAGGLDDYRTMVDALLDAVDLAPVSGRFSERGVAARRQLLRDWLSGTEPADDLMHRPRPSDANEPNSLAASNEMNMAAIRAHLATVPEAQKQIDPVTGLVKYRPPATISPPITDGLGPTGTPVRLRRQLAYSSYVVIASFFLDDIRQMSVEVFA